MEVRSRARMRTWLQLLAASLCLPFSAQLFAEEGEIEEVVVTGTYIKGTPEDAALPVTTLQREDLALEGSPTATDLIKSMSFSQGADGETDLGVYADYAGDDDEERTYSTAMCVLTLEVYYRYFTPLLIAK